MDETHDSVSRVEGGDGFTVPLRDGWFNRLVTEAQYCAGTDGRATDVTGRHVDAHDTRFDVWDNQSVDGRRWASVTGAKVRPFDGAFDTRTGKVNEVVDELSMLCVLAALRAELLVKGIEGDDERRATNANLYLTWVLNNELGIEWIEALMQVAQYMNGDSPGVALLTPGWRRQPARRLKRLTVQQVVELYLQNLGLSPSPRAAGEGTTPPMDEATAAEARQAASGLLAALQGGDVTPDELAVGLQQFFPELKPSRAKMAARQLIETGECEFPVLEIVKDGPTIAAERYNEDFYIASNTEEFGRATAVFRVEHLTLTDVEDAALEEGWDPAFKEAVLRSEGQAAFPAWRRNTETNKVTSNPDEMRARYEIVRAEFRAATDDGVVGIYEVAFSLTAKAKTESSDSSKKSDPAAIGAAYEPRLVEWPWWGYSGHLFKREVLDRKALNSRGWADLLGSHQSLRKVLMDGVGNHAQIAPLPPVVGRGRRTQGALHLKSLGYTELQPDGDLKFLDPPPFPVSALKMGELIQTDMDVMAGRIVKGRESEAQLRKQWAVIWFLANVKVVLTRILQLAQAYETPERLARIVNDDGAHPLGTKDDLKGKFDLVLLYDPDDMNPETVLNKAKALGEILALDQTGGVDTRPLVAAVLRRFAPNWAAVSLRGLERAREDEIEDEKKKFLDIVAGRLPARRPDGSENYAVRLAWYEDTVAQNPTAFDWLPPDKRTLLDSHLEYLTAQAQQYGANRQIGREGAKRPMMGTPAPAAPQQGEAA